MAMVGMVTSATGFAANSQPAPPLGPAADPVLSATMSRLRLALFGPATGGRPFKLRMSFAGHSAELGTLAAAPKRPQRAAEAQKR